MRLLLIGPPGSGKGTQAIRLGAHLGVEHISSGELLRKHANEETGIGRTVKPLLDRGDLVPDGIVMDILRKPVEAASRRGGYILDGFPRTVAQAEAAYLVAREIGAWVQVALYLQVPRERLIERAMARGKAAGRADDTLEVINHRLRVFDDLTLPLLDYYDNREILVTVDGDQSVDEVTASAIARLDAVRAQLS
jgi:adenylate kinase